MIPSFTRSCLIVAYPMIRLTLSPTKPRWKMGCSPLYHTSALSPGTSVDCSQP